MILTEHAVAFPYFHQVSRFVVHIYQNVGSVHTHDFDLAVTVDLKLSQHIQTDWRIDLL